LPFCDGVFGEIRTVCATKEKPLIGGASVPAELKEAWQESIFGVGTRKVVDVCDATLPDRTSTRIGKRTQKIFGSTTKEEEVKQQHRNRRT